jgi:hypothetical protein
MDSVGDALDKRSGWLTSAAVRLSTGQSKATVIFVTASSGPAGGFSLISDSTEEYTTETDIDSDNDRRLGKHVIK